MHPCVDSIKPFEFTLNLAQVANTYDACVASNGDVMILGANLYVVTAGTIFTSVSVQTNQTNFLTLMTAGEGALANILAQAHPVCAAQAWIAPWTLRNGQKIQYTMVGALGTGSMRLFGYFIPITPGAVLV